MKRIIGLCLLLIISFSLYSSPVNPAQVTISMTTTVPSILVHGFLLSGDSTAIASSASVEDAFNPDGATFTYAIQTNTDIPLEVTATVSPFALQGALVPSLVRIGQVSVNSSQATVIDSNAGTYKLLDFTPSASGMHVYSYTLTVKADQDQVSTAPAGSYESTVSIGISPKN